MAIIPYRDTVLVRIYKCGMCKHIYLGQTGTGNVIHTCTAFHSEGSCCHHGERSLLDEETFNELLEGLRADFQRWQT